MAGTAPDFTTLTDAQLAQFAVAHQDALDIGGLVEVDIVTAVAAGRASLERRSYGFAIIEQRPATGGTIPQLWLLFVAPRAPGQRLGAPLHAGAAAPVRHRVPYVPVLPWRAALCFLRPARLPHREQRWRDAAHDNEHAAIAPRPPDRIRQDLTLQPTFSGGTSAPSPTGCSTLF